MGSLFGVRDRLFYGWVVVVVFLVISIAFYGIHFSFGVFFKSIEAEFGLSRAARPVLNSMMLHHAVQHGLDMAIVHASKVKPYTEIPEEERQLMEDLIFNRHPDALQRVIEHYEGVTIEEESQVDPTEGMTPEEHDAILQQVVRAAHQLLIDHPRQLRPEPPAPDFPAIWDRLRARRHA